MDLLKHKITRGKLYEDKYESECYSFDCQHMQYQYIVYHYRDHQVLNPIVFFLVSFRPIFCIGIVNADVLVKSIRTEIRIAVLPQIDFKFSFLFYWSIQASNETIW